ncbi:MAG: amino acid ABC transporter substrate-binding protein [Treponema sp.]|nr:amino acid ABC transporter substrate-binding protein [Treponema sp.]
MKKSVLFVFAPVIAVLSVVLSCGGGSSQTAPGGTAAEAPPQVSQSTLQTIKNRGYIIAGVNATNQGFAFLESDGSYKGFEIELAKALSAAVFGVPDKLEFRPLTSAERFVALQSGEIDVLIRTATINITRDTQLGLDFTTPYFYDGQTFIVRADAGVNRLEDLKGSSIAVITGSTTETNLAAVMASRSISYQPVTYKDFEEVKNALISGRVDAISADKSAAVVFLEQYGAGGYKGLEETISKEPLGMAVRHGDNNWKDIVQWTLFALFFGDEHNITSANIDQVKDTATNPEIKKFLGIGLEHGAMLGLANDWAYQVIKQAGNYGEIFDRTLGIPMHVTRGFNKPWTQGGLFYANPFN